MTPPARCQPCQLQCVEVPAPRGFTTANLPARLARPSHGINRGWSIRTTWGSAHAARLSMHLLFLSEGILLVALDWSWPVVPVCSWPLFSDAFDRKMPALMPGEFSQIQASGSPNRLEKLSLGKMIALISICSCLKSGICYPTLPNASQINDRNAIS